MSTIWDTLPRPFFALAPMEDVTDTVFRQIVGECAPPNIFFTEFTNVDGMMSHGKDEVMHRLKFTKKEKPIIAQLWGSAPQNFYHAAQMVQKLGFDGIDINMGCPEKKVVKKGLCAALIQNRMLVNQIITATIEGAGTLPVSVKTRIGYNTIETESWISFLLAFQLAALTIHARTAKEMSEVPAHWDEIHKAVLIRNNLRKNTLIIGNGDVTSYNEGVSKSKEFGVDGIMIGRGIFKNLWVFDPTDDPIEKTIQKKIILLQKHITLFAKTWKHKKNFHSMKKFYKIYVQGFDHASMLRTELMALGDSKQTIQYLTTILKRYD